MPDTHDKFHSANGKRLVLIVDDEPINREILGGMLEETYDLIFAATGEEALEQVTANRDMLSLVLLDLILPGMHGLEVLRVLKADEYVSHIPVIVMTSDRESEVESLSLGAIDFIPKPYPEPKVVHARVRRTIELSEDRDIITKTERDPLTGLYNRQFFYRYAEQFDQHHKDLVMDAVVVDVNRFHMINERYGKAYGDEVLCRIGERVRDMVRDSGGIVCRRESDTFLVYCPHRQDYSEILISASEGLAGEAAAGSRVRLRMGIYSEVDKSIDMERRFDRAKLAADTVRNSFTKAIAIYDSVLHESELFAEQLIEEFHSALVAGQFMVYYQPKYNIRGPEPVLASAEALVRWQHPKLGLINPGVFVPLFEGNGLVTDLDNFVWEETARQIRDWKDRLGYSVPVSVNISRVDMYDPGIADHISGLTDKYGLDPSDLLLEITESAYTEDSDQIVDMVNRLRSAGFSIEMDDFGTGYSSLNMISNLPIDALKLDMQFIKSAFSERKDIRMLAVIIEIAESLGVPTIAEGVETAEHLFTLKSMGCDIAQGYYFSGPVPAEEFEPFIIERRDLPEPVAEEITAPRTTTFAARGRHEKFTYDALHDPVTGLYNGSAFDVLLRDSDQAHTALLIVKLAGCEEVLKGSDGEASSSLLIRAANALRDTFRSVDHLCRIGRDEFAVIMTRVDSSMSELIMAKASRICSMLGSGSGPAVDVRVGAAFSDRSEPHGTLLEDADEALAAAGGSKGACVIFGAKE